MKRCWLCQGWSNRRVDERRGRGHELAGSKTAVELYEKDRTRSGCLGNVHTAQVQVARVRIMLPCESDKTLTPVAEKVGLADGGVRLCVTKFLESGVERMLNDDARTFVVGLAYQCPTDAGHYAELWTITCPQRVGREVEAVGHPRLAMVIIGTVHNILADALTEPHGIDHCREQHDPNFGAGTCDMLPPRAAPRRGQQPHSLGGKLGGAVCRPATRGLAPRPSFRLPPDLRPRRGSGRGAVKRDTEHVRLETPSPLASIDLPAGEACEGFDHAGVPGIRGGRYPRGGLTGIVPSDVPARTFVETRRYLATV